MSDYLPILLKCCTISSGRPSRIKRFMFENMWVSDPSCVEVVSAAWSARPADDPVERLIERVETCAGELSRWNRKVFGHVGTEIHKLDVQLQGQRDAVSRRETLGQIREWRRREEILWWQRARSNYLKFGDANTRWFHTRVTMRRSRNSIHCLVDDNGVRWFDAGGISNVIVQYFSNLFTSSHALDMDDVRDCVPSHVTTDMNNLLCAPYMKEEVDRALH